MTALPRREVKAAVARQAGAPFSIERLELEGPAPDEILVRIAGAGICHTDLVMKDTPLPPTLPAVLGHEGAGFVEAVGERVTGVNIGDRAILSFASCGACRHCSDGLPGYCDAAPVLNYLGARKDGSSALSDAHGPVASHFFGQSSFATHAVVYESNIVKAPDDLPLELLGPFGCGIQTGAGAVLNVFKANAGASILIAGGGAVGLSAVMAAVVAGCDPIIVSDPMESRRSLALELGATHVHDPLTEPIKAVLKRTTRHGVNYAFDTTGRRDVLEATFGALSKRGVLACVGLASEAAPNFEVSINNLMSSGRRIVGVIEGDSAPATFIPTLLDLHRNGKFPFDQMITTYPLEAINDAIVDQAEGKCVKPVLLM